MSRARASSTSWLWMTALAVITIGYAWAAATHVAPILVPESDAWGHLAAVRRTLESGWFPGDPYYAAYPTPPQYSLAHVLFAIGSLVTGMAPHQLWLAVPPLVAVVTILATFMWLRVLTTDSRVAAAGAACVLLVQAPSPAWWALPHPRGLALAPFALSQFCYVHARSRASVPLLLAAGLALGLCLGLHLVTGAVCFLTLFLTEAAWSGRPHRSRHLLQATAVAIIVAIPCLANVANGWLRREIGAPGSFGFTEAMASDSWSIEILSLTMTGQRPRALLGTFPSVLWPAVVMGLAFACWRWLTGRATLGDRYALLATATTLLLLLTPLFGLLTLVAQVWTTRLAQLAPLPLLVGLGVAGVVEIASRPRRTPLMRATLMTLAALSIGWIVYRAGVLIHADARTWAGASSYLRKGGPLGEWNLLDQLVRSGPPPHVAISDTDTSYLLPYYLGTTVVSVPAGHASPYVDHMTRERNARKAFALRTPIRETLAIFDQYEVDLVVVNKDSLWPSPGAGERLLGRLRRHSAFRETGCCGSLVMLRYERQKPPAPP
jgi:hypothetical protein